MGDKNANYNELSGYDLGLDGLDEMLADLHDLPPAPAPEGQESSEGTKPSENGNGTAKEAATEEKPKANGTVPAATEKPTEKPDQKAEEEKAAPEEAARAEGKEDKAQEKKEDRKEEKPKEEKPKEEGDNENGETAEKPATQAEEDEAAPAKPVKRKGAAQKAKSKKPLPDAKPAFDAPTSEVTITVECLLPTGQIITLTELPVDSTIGYLKTVVVEKVKGGDFTALSLGIDEYLIKIGGQVVLDDDRMENLNVVQQNIEGNRVTKVSIVDRAKEKAKENKLMSVQISTLLGRKSKTYPEGSLHEVNVFRSRIVPLIKAEMMARKEGIYQFAPHITQAALPTSIASVIEKPFLVRLHVNNTAQHKTVKWNLSLAPAAILDQVFSEETLVKLIEGHTPDMSANDYMLKAYGMQDYLIGDHSLYKFFHVRKALLKHKDIHVSVVPKRVAERANVGESDIYLLEDPPEYLMEEHDHQDLTLHSYLDVDSEPEVFSIWDITRKFSVRIAGIDGISWDFPEKTDSHGHVKKKTGFRASALMRKSVKVNARWMIYCTVGMYFGSELLVPLVTTKMRPCSECPRFGDFLTFDINVRDVPKAARLCVTTYLTTSGEPDPARDSPLAWCNCLIIDHLDYLRCGRLDLGMWQWERANPIGMCEANPDPDAPVMSILFDEYPKPVVFPSIGYTEPVTTRNNARTGTIVEPKDPKSLEPTKVEMKRIDEISCQNPLYKLSRDEKDLLWKYRYYILDHKPTALCKLLRATPWNSVKSVQELYRLLPRWPQFEFPLDALELLDADYPDARVRTIGTENLNRLDDDEIMDYLIQLVQALKYENNLDNPLARFLIRRCLRSRPLGHDFFWCLKSEMHMPNVADRFGHYLEAYLRGCGQHRHQLLLQVNFVNCLIDAALYIKNDSNRSREKLQEKLTRVPFKEEVQLVHSPSLEVRGIKIEKCKFMDSKKLPLWLVLQSADTYGADTYVIFKEGDDLRQDMLTLQMIRIMDKVWQQNDLDLRMNPYAAVSTGDGQGFIEVVLNSETIAKIQMAHGGARSAFKDEPLKMWLQKHNTADAMNAAVENFVYSCAGYAVATYVLGIGDRHNDNIMIQEDGHLFHIDFGHFLGNVKSKFGVKRERTPFVFTPDMVFVMGGKESESFKLFSRLCCSAFNVLRQNANMLINLFALMLSTGIPELQSSEDLEYLIRVLVLDKSDEEASVFFLGLIEECLSKGWTTQFNWWIHNVVHGR